VLRHRGGAPRTRGATGQLLLPGAERRLLLRALTGYRTARMTDATLGPDDFVHALTRHGRTLWVLAAAWVGRSEAEDLVQETARVAWQQRADFAPGTDLRAWLSRIARNLCANHRRRPRPEPRPVADLPERAAPPSPVAVAWPVDPDRSGFSDDLARALLALPEVARACLLLHVILGHSFAEIATMLDLPENTATSHARRARLALRTALEAAATEATRALRAP
jgi:RNA polymerase sigma-70 factor (ECF subfamily)